MEAGDWSLPTSIRFGPGRVRELPDVIDLLAIDRPLLVTDQALATLPMIGDVVSLLRDAGIDVGVYSGVQGNPTLDNVNGGLTMLREEDRDGVIAIGGGSALDAAKTIAMMAEQRGLLWEYAGDDEAWMRINPRAMFPVIAIPTTAGTGSEVGRAAVILDEETHSKRIVWHPGMMPVMVISDPELTVGLPPNLTAWTGVDAMVHALEAYCSPAYHPIAEGIAIEAIRRVVHWLPTAVADGDNIEARGNMLVAASMGATAFQKGLGSVHSISHVVGALYDTHHGLTNAIVLPYGLRQNLPACGDKLAHLGTVLGLEDASAEGFIRHMDEFLFGLDIPSSLGAIEVDAERATEIGRLALEDPTAETNAMPLDAALLERLFLAAQAGDASALR